VLNFSAPHPYENARLREHPEGSLGHLAGRQASGSLDIQPTLLRLAGAARPFSRITDR